MKFYAIHYWFSKDDVEHYGTWYEDTLTMVGAFYGMVERYGGHAECNISKEGMVTL